MNNKGESISKTISCARFHTLFGNFLANDAICTLWQTSTDSSIVKSQAGTETKTLKYLPLIQDKILNSSKCKLGFGCLIWDLPETGPLQIASPVHPRPPILGTLNLTMLSIFMMLRSTGLKYLLCCTYV